MKRLPALCFALLLALTSSAFAELGSDVHAILRDPFITKCRDSIKLIRLAPGGHAVTLFEDKAADPQVPASNLKLITTSAIMEKLGPDFKFRTLLLSDGQDLILVGDGDPSFGDADMLKKVGWDVNTVFQTWAAGLAQRKLGPVRRLLVDDSIFDSTFIHPNWPADQVQKHYVAEVAGMNLNANVADIFVKPTSSGQIVRYLTDPPTRYFSIKNSCISGGENAIWLSREPDTNALILRGSASQANDVPVTVTIHDPPMYAATLLAETLQANGISVGSVSRDRTFRQRYERGDSSLTLLAVHQTPLTQVMARANKESINLYAECMSKRLGAAVFGEGSWPKGAAATGEFLQQLGVPVEQYKLDDGCGLSKQNAISANLMTTVLAHDFYSPNAKSFMDTMAVVGVDGTMAERFKGTDLRGRVLAKSGFVNGVSCLSGFLHAKDNNWYGFAILFNDVPAGGTGQAKTIEERIVRAMDLNSIAKR